ncbi:MAG TPA: DUF1772 domain-containing protein [Ktedonosporobacter sp.]|nr:DUF1772 domain-containing protein [Ktedonosporobacter sp.]
MDILGFVSLVIIGFTACAEFGSYAFVHPVIRELSAEPHVQVEQGLLKTFGRIMPVFMTLCVVLAIAYAIQMNGQQGLAWGVRWAAAVALTLALISTIIFNVPVNLATGRWDSKNLPSDWKETRTRWEFFQGVRSWLLLIGFVLLSLALTLK